MLGLKLSTENAGARDSLQWFGGVSHRASFLAEPVDLSVSAVRSRGFQPHLALASWSIPDTNL